LAKQRIYELARTLGLESKEVLTRAQELGIAAKTASSGLEEDEAALVTLSFEEGSVATEAVAAEPAEETAPAEEPSPAAEPSGEPVAEADAEDAADDPATDEATEVVAPADSSVTTESEATEQPADDDRILIVQSGVTAQDFARLVGVRTGDIVRELMQMGELVPGGGQIPADSIEALGRIYGHEVLIEEGEEVEEEEVQQRSIVEYEDDPASLKTRPPVVTVMGHVDHGKTQLLDTIRKTDVIAGEAGGITQHIGAYQVTRPDGTITFIDTPGHEAFTALRARGADVTDIAIIVVAADDGVMPQTVEAISHAKAAEVPIIIAINKMDLESADPYAVRAALTQHGLVVEELGGDVVDAEVSALTGDGIESLLEMVSLVAEVEDFQANPSARSVGTVIESQLEVGRGPTATVIVQRGTLKRGDAVVAGAVSGRVRAMFDENGAKVDRAGPSAPVLIMGWDDVPSAGDMFEVVANERVARKQAQAKLGELRARDLTVPTAAERFGNLLEQFRTADHAELRIIIKADAHGSLEAIRDAVAKISREDGRITLIQAAVGGITENDIALADASDAMVYGFNVRPDAGARRAAKETGIDIRTFLIIYELLEDVESLLVGELAPEEIETFLGVADVRAVFRAPRYGFVAGCYVTEGEINRNARARLVRDGVVIYDGLIASLRRFKEDVPTVAVGFECGIGLQNFRDIKEGDTIESYEVKEVART
jgi:translation initiation factor IF-2